MGSVFFLAGIAELLNYTSFMAIFNSRFGTAYLPIMYLIEAFLLPAEGWFLSWLSQRLSKPRFMIAMYLLLIGIGIANSAVLFAFWLLHAAWLYYYPILYLSSNFVVRQQTMLMWSTAFDLCPTQQAKRVMPKFVLLAVMGGIVAGIFSRTFASALGPETLYMLYAGFLLLGLPNFLQSLRQYLVPLTLKSEEADSGEEAPPSGFYFRQILRSPFLLTAIGIMTLMPALYFLIEYQYFTAAHAAFPSETQLTSFYGMMVILLFSGAFLLQLFASKLMEYLGASNLILAITIVYAASFGAVSLLVRSPWALAAVSFGYCLTYLSLYYFAEPGYQYFFKMLPIQQRDGYRYTAQGIAASAGILIGSGLSMLHTEAGLSLTWQASIGLGLAVLLVGLAWGGRHLYIRELVRYLKVSASMAKDLLGELLESMKHDRIRQTLLEKLQHPDLSVQQAVIELFHRNPDPLVAQPLFAYARQSVSHLRPLVLAAIPPAGWKTLQQEARDAWLRDPDPEIRATAYRKLFLTESPAGDLAGWTRQALADPHPAVRAEALCIAEITSELEDELRKLLGEGGEPAVLACRIIGERQLDSFYSDLLMCLFASSPIVKIAAVRAIGRIGGQEAATNLTELVLGADLELREAIEQALVEAGAAATPELLRFVDSPNPKIWRTMVAVLTATGTEKELREAIVPACEAKLTELTANRADLERILASGHAEWSELARKRSEEIAGAILDTVWAVMVRFGDERSIPRLRSAVENPDVEIRDHGLEILTEGFGDSRLAAALLYYYQQELGLSPAKPNPQETEPAQEQNSFTSDPWLQAIAIKSGAVEGETMLMQNWDYLSALDKIVLLKQIPLFDSISIEELGRIAGIARERIYQENEYLLRQGESSYALYILVEGHVELSGVSENGVEGTLGVLGPKQSIGEGSLFDDRPSQISAQVLFEPVRALEISREETEHLVRLYPDIGVGLLRAVGVRLRTMEQLLLKLG